METVYAEENRIAFVINSINSLWAQNVWPPFVRCARKLKKDLFIFPGGCLGTCLDSDNLRNSIYSMLNTENLEGLILFSPCLVTNETTEEEFKRFYSGFKQLPLVSLADKISGHPSVVFNGYLGVKQLTTHCIKVHGAEKIAFICGPGTHYDTLQRLKGYKDALKEAGPPVSCDDLLVTDYFDWGDGRKAAAQLFEERKLIPGRDFDTIVGASDEMTVDAIDYFSRHGFNMPRDYHALGFDNSLDSLFPESPLSTVMASYSEVSSEAFRVLIDYMDKFYSLDNGSSDPIPIEDVLLAMKPVIRNSCGCGGSNYRFVEPEPAVNFYDLNEESLIARIVEYMELGEREIKIFITPMIRALFGISQKSNTKPMESVERIFFHRFKRAVVCFFNTNNDSGLLLRLLQDLFNSGVLSASQFRKFEPVMLKIIFKAWERSSIRAQFKRKELDTTLNSLRLELLESRDRDSLVKSLAKHLPKIGIETAGLALYVDDRTSLWIGSYSAAGLCPLRDQSFSAKLLVPESLKNIFSRGVFMVQPLFIEERALGYFVHTVSGYDGSVYEELRSTISYALKGIFQFEEVVKAQRKVLEGIEQNRILTLQKEAAQAASEAKSQFLASVSHEIRTPMNAVLGMAELMLSENLNDRQRRYTEDIRISAMALLNIINEILDLSKIQSGKMDLIPVHYDFKALVDNIGSMVHFLIKSKNVAFDINMQGDIPRCLYGDNVRLRQILLNLLSNAAKFTEKGYVRLSLSASDKDIHFAVIDTGMGMKEEDIPSLFDAFKQADVVRNRNYKGTGLGLTITKSLVEMMGGEIKVESVYGEGTTVHVVIPKVIGDESQIQRLASTKKIICSPDTNILAVDDNAINLNVITGLLRQCGVTVFSAASGKEAIEMLRLDKYDLIFMDYMMPEMDGIETTKIIHEMGISTPVVALTANAIANAKEMLLASGMDDFLSKPVLKEQLYEMLIKWIPGSKYIDSQIEEAVDGASYSNEDRELWNKLSDIEGLSCKVGLERVSGQIEIYKDTLKLFAKETQKCIVNLDKLLTENDLHNFTIQIHSAKSSLANIGAMNLSAKAYELESAASRRDAGFCVSHLRSFLDELNDLNIKLTEALFGLNRNKIQSVISPELRLILTRIKGSLNKKNFIEINNDLKNLETQKPEGSLKDKIEEITDAIIIMDYQNALDLIQELFNNDKA